MKKIINKRQIYLGLFIGLFCAVGSMGLYKGFALTPSGTYTNWTWPANADPNAYTSLEYKLNIENVTPRAPYFWAHQFQIKNGDGGYIGLQSEGYTHATGTTGKTAIFSIFGSGTANDGTQNCVTELTGFDGGPGGGTSCIIPYEWVTGVDYSLKLVQTVKDTNGQWWEASVQNTKTHATTNIAKIRVPISWSGLGEWSSNWTEHFGAQPDNCGLLPYSKVKVTNVLMNAGKVKPRTAQNNVASGDCKNSKITAVAGGYRQEMGNIKYPAPYVPAPPSRPTSLKVARYRTSSINTAQLTWVGSADDSTINSYRIYRNNALLLEVKHVPKQSANTQNYIDRVLPNSTRYTYQVSAVDKNGKETAKSTSVNITTCSKYSPANACY